MANIWHGLTEGRSIPDDEQIMASYTVHFPKGVGPEGIDADALTGAVLIKDGFSKSAFFFSFFWFFWNRLWLAGLGVLVALIAMDTLLEVFHVNHFFAAIAQILFMILVGLEANSLKRWTFARNGRPVATIVTGQDEIEAEAKMLALGLGNHGHGRRPTVSPGHIPPIPPFRPTNSTLGLFPVSERSR